MRPAERLSLRARIAAALTLVTLLAIGAQSGALLWVAAEDEEALIDQILAQQVERSIEEYYDHPGGPHALPERMRFFVDGERGGAAPAPFAALPPGNHELVLKDTEYHVAVRSREGRTFRLAFDVSDHERRLQALVRLVAASSIAVAALVLALSYWLAGLLLARIAALARRVDRDAEEAAAFVAEGMEPEVKSLAAALDRYRERHRRLIAREREFTADASHELRTPLTGIRTSAELIAEDAAAPPRARRRAADIVGAVDRLMELVRALLFLARELPQDEAQTVGVAHAVRQALAPLAEAASDKGLALSVEVPDQAAVRAPAGMLDLVVGNLLANAVRYTERGGVAVRWEAGPPARLAVTDTGPGIAPDLLPQVFERHARGQAGGSGLGLAIARRVSEACGWRLELLPAPGGGTRAQIVFPPTAFT